MSEFGAVKAGDVVEIRLTDEDAPKIQFLINKQLLYTSTEETPSRLCAKVIAYYQTPLVEELQWVFESASQRASPRASRSCRFDRISAVFVAATANKIATT